MDRLLFGTAGIPHSSKAATTPAGIERTAELGLGCMEIEFVHGVRMDLRTALLVAETARSKGIALTAHCPYYINLNARETDKLKASRDRIIKTAEIAKLCGATSIVFHAAFYMGDEPNRVYRNVKEQIQQITDHLRSEENNVCVRVEVMGKPSQFGMIEEVLALSAEISGVAPCLDFAHLHARTGKCNSYDEFVAILQTVKSRLGKEALNNMHIHVSGVEYGAKGERKHLNFPESDFDYKDFARALYDCKAKGLIIVESPNLEEDALLLQQTYTRISQK